LKFSYSVLPLKIVFVLEFYREKRGVRVSIGTESVEVERVREREGRERERERERKRET